MTLTELLGRYPPPSGNAARSTTREELARTGTRIVVLDDDPTGTQTVHGVPVYTRWTPEDLDQALVGQHPVFYLSTNSRALAAQDAAALAREIGLELVRAAERTGVPAHLIVPASRSDSTLRGHFPGEVTALFEGLGRTPDGVLIVPAFFEGGRYTVGDTHYVEQNGQAVPAHETEFARDPDFGYGTSNLRDWVEEKTHGAVTAEEVLSIGLETIRSEGPAGVTAVLDAASQGVPVVVNACCYADLETVVAGLHEAERHGRTFAYRCAASFVKVRAGIEDRALLTRAEMIEHEGPGLVVAGSYVEKTTRQLRTLLDGPRIAAVELSANRLLGQEAAAEVRRAVTAVENGFAAGRDVVCYTSRRRVATSDASSLTGGRRIMEGLCDVIESLGTAPSWIIAKGGITSIEVGRTALGVSRAMVLGQIIGGVPVWRLDEKTRFPGIPYVVFPGNVGDDTSLLGAYRILTVGRHNE